MLRDIHHGLRLRLVVLSAVVGLAIGAQTPAAAAERQWVFKEAEDAGRKIVSAEAEHCSSIGVGRVAFVGDASGGQVLYCPDEDRTHRGRVKVASYRFRIETPGRWYVWLRAFAAHHIQNGLYIEVDGRRLVDPKGGDGAVILPKGGWGWSERWQGKKNTNRVFVDIQQPGEHTLTIVRREPMTYYDKILLTHGEAWVPPKNDLGPDETVANTGGDWQGPPSYGLHGIQDFNRDKSSTAWVTAKSPASAPHLRMAEGADRAAIATPFQGRTGRYTLRLEYLAGKDNRVEYSIRVGGKTVGTFLTDAGDDYPDDEPFNSYVRDVAIANGQAIEVAAVSKNGSRARWRRLFLYGQ